ncbi:4-alpha-glucanotransferase [Candidatus Chlorohelix allophototropha]|nr:4-alpha-glucanotransferase [Chloroflexota bacterium L227-S17]
MFERCSGILLHPTSLPGPYGIGELGEMAYRFVDFLVATDQTLWQFMPLNQTGYGDSPYYSLSAFAGNPLLINLDKLVEEGFLKPEDLHNLPNFPAERVDFGPVIDFKKRILGKSYQRFKTEASPDVKNKLAEFEKDNKTWLPDFALFMALKDHFGGAVWNKWDGAIVQHEANAITQWQEKLADEVGYYSYCQFLFNRQWLALRQYANEKGIKLIADIPIFVAYDSSDVWANSGLFYLDDELNPTHVAGVPPDYFSETGQRWGNPLYNWDKLKTTGYEWWIERFRQALKMADIVRIDHFRGFYNYWAVPASEETAIKGEWRMGPGADVFDKIREALGDCPIVAEDLGDMVPEVYELRDQLGLPGMKIIQFAFSDDALNPFLPHNHTKNSIVYTGSHDNDTSIGWYEKAPAEEQHRARMYTNSDGRDINWGLIKLSFSSVADMAIIPLQEVLGLGSEGRMNFPGRPAGNWQWRFSYDQLSSGMAEYLKTLTILYGRDPETIKKRKKLAERNSEKPKV